MRRVFDSVSRGFLLILIGVIFFLVNFGILSWGFWSNVIDLWPLILILAGIGLLFNRRIPFSAVLLVFLLILVGYSITFGDRPLPLPSPFSGSTTGVSSLDVPLESGIDKAHLELNVGGAQVQVSALDQSISSQRLMSGNYTWEGRGYGSGPRLNTKRSGNTMNVTLNTEKPGSGGEHLDLNLSDKVSYSLDINAGAIDGNLDLSQFAVDDFELNTGASKFQLQFGDKGKVTQARINGGASKITLVVPENVGLKVHLSGVVSNTNFMGSGLAFDNKDWVSPNYDQAASKIDLDISTAAGSVNLERPGAKSVNLNQM